MITEFNKSLINEYSKLHTNKFEDVYFEYKKLIREQTKPASDEAAPQPAPEQPAPEQPAPEERQDIVDLPAEKSYTDILIIIAKALKANLMGSAKFGTSNFDSYEYLKTFAESWIAQEDQAEQIKDNQAVKKITDIQHHLDNILGRPEQMDVQ